MNLLYQPSSHIRNEKLRDTPLKDFFDMLFAPDDFVELRLIETWTDNQRRQSFAWKTAVWRAQNVVEWHGGVNAVAARCMANVFFGVCPRPVPRCGYGKSGYIGTVRCLWCDIDDCRPAEAEERVAKATLPRSSAVVESGNGCHLYWALGAPLTIPLTYELDARGEPLLSEQAIHVQRVLQGIASKIGGDHTQDLARLLRLPGTMNRKDQRNGRTPVLCHIHSLHPDRRYSFSDIEPFQLECPAPWPRRASAPTRASNLAGSCADSVVWGELTPRQQRAVESLIAQAASAPVGERSEADFALCVFAYKLGLDAEDIWQRMQDVGKFAERGHDYFAATWRNAKGRVDDERAQLQELYGDLWFERSMIS